MKKIVIVLVVLLSGYTYFHDQQNSLLNNVSTASQSPNTDKSDAVLAQAFSNHESNLQVTGEGTVTKLLPDDTNGSRHQKFIVKLGTGQTLLVAHNIDLASRIDQLGSGDTVEFSGEYEWNEKGGVLHWTHRDPNGTHPAGWIKHNGQTYQ